MSQCTYRCVVLPDLQVHHLRAAPPQGLNAPTGAWCSLTPWLQWSRASLGRSQCTYRCVVLPDSRSDSRLYLMPSLSQCTYRCVVLPDQQGGNHERRLYVSMHLQVRGAP